MGSSRLMRIPECSGVAGYIKREERTCHVSRGHQQVRRIAGKASVDEVV